MVAEPCRLRFLFVKLLEGFSIRRFPSNKSVCASAMYNCRRRGARELRILVERQKSVFLNESSVGDEFFALGYGPRIRLSRWALLQDCRGDPWNTTKPFAVRCPCASAPLIRQKSTPPG